MQPVYFHQYWPISYEEIVPYYNIAERIMTENRNYAMGSTLQQTLLNRLQSTGYSEAGDLPLAVDLGVTKLGRIHSSVFFSSIIFLARALNLRPFDLAVNTRAVKVLIDKGRAVEVELMTPDKKTHVIHAKTVILATSTFETPRLLLHSALTAPVIGRYLINHPFLIAQAKASRDQFPEVEGVASVIIPETSMRRHQIQIFGPDQLNYYWYHYKEKPLMKDVELRLDSFSTVEPRPVMKITYLLTKKYKARRLGAFPNRYPFFLQ